MTAGIKLVTASIAILAAGVLLWRSGPGTGSGELLSKATGSDSKGGDRLIHAPLEGELVQPRVSPEARASASAAKASRADVAALAGRESQASSDSSWAYFELTILDEADREPQPGLRVDLERSLADGTRLDSGSGSDPISRDWPYETDAAGRIAGKVRPGIAMSAAVMSLGFEGALTTLELEAFQEGERRAFELHVDSASLRGFWIQIIAEESQLPLSEAAVWEVDPYGASLSIDETRMDTSNWLETEPIQRADPNGRVLLPLSFRTQKRFVASARGRGLAFFSIDKAADRPEKATTVGLPESAEVRVRVVGSHQEPVAGVAVRLTVEHASRPIIQALHGQGQHHITRSTDETGSAFFERVNVNANIRVALCASDNPAAWQFAEDPLPALVGGERRELTLDLRGRTDVHGIALDQHGAPAAGIEMCLFQDSGQLPGYLQRGYSSQALRRTTVAPDGRFRWEGVPAGRWLAAPRMERDHLGRLSEEELDWSKLVAPIPTAFTLSGTEPVHSLPIELHRGLYVRGVVVNPDGELATEGRIRARLGEAGAFLMQMIHTDGTFVLGPLPDVVVSLSAWGFEPPTKSAAVLAQPGASDVTLRLEQTGSMTLRALTANGVGAAASFRAWRTSSAGDIVDRVEYDPHSAAVDCDGLAMGTWHVFAKGPGKLVGYANEIELRAGDVARSIDIHLQPSGTLTVRRASSVEREKRRVDLRLGGFPMGECKLAPGEHSVLWLPPGNFEVIDFDALGESLSPQQVQIQAGVASEVLLY